MLGALDNEVLPAGTAGFEIQFAAHGEHGITHCLGLQLAAVLPPEQRVEAVVCFTAGISGGRALPVGGTGDDEFVQLLERAAQFIAEGDRQPV